jgi:hypothetical protein
LFPKYFSKSSPLALDVIEWYRYTVSGRQESPLLLKEDTLVVASTHPVYGADAAGCWFGSARGIYVGQAVIELALHHDWKPADVSGEITSPDHEFYCELWDEAEQFMDRFAADGYWFGANENGDWGLWQSEDEL